MNEYVNIEYYVNHVMGEITKRDVEQVSERLRALGWEEVVRCRDCESRGSQVFDKAEAITAWNECAERTGDYKQAAEYWQRMYEETFAERMCKNISDPPNGFLCSSCGWGDFSEPSHLLTSACFRGGGVGPNYCPNCGAKVIKEKGKGND